MRAKDLAWKVLPMPIVARAAWWKYWFKGEWELHELAKLLPADGLAIDVGANVGYYTYALKRLGRNVVSFEPDRTYGNRLRALLGGAAQIETVALSSHPGTGIIRVPRVSGGAYGGSLASLSENAVPDENVASSYETELRTLDSYGFDDVAFIKIDVEGHEEAVLAGAEETLRRCKPVLLIEIEERHNRGGLDRIAQRLSVLGYSGSFFYQRKRHDLADFSTEIHQIVDKVTDGHGNRREYVNNFVFAAR